MKVIALTLTLIKIIKNILSFIVLNGESFARSVAPPQQVIHLTLLYFRYVFPRAEFHRSQVAANYSHSRFLDLLRP